MPIKAAKQHSVNGQRSAQIAVHPPPSTGMNYNLVDKVEHEPNDKVIWKIIRSPDGDFVYDYRLKAGRRKRRKKCPGCGDFLDQGQRNCLKCQAGTRKARNRRHYQVLKTRFKTGLP